MEKQYEASTEHGDIVAKSSVAVDDVEEPKGRGTSNEPDEQWLTAERRVVRKLDMTLVLMIWVLYLFNYLDRNNIAQAKLSSFEKDLGLKGNDFNVAVSILNVGYMLMQLPRSVITRSPENGSERGLIKLQTAICSLTRTRPSLYVPSWTAIWSIISATTAAAGNDTHLITIQFFLGIAEAPLFPAAMFLLSS